MSKQQPPVVRISPEAHARLVEIQQQVKAETTLTVSLSEIASQRILADAKTAQP